MFLSFFLSFFFLLQTLFFLFAFPAPPNIDSITQLPIGVGPAIAPGYSALHATNGSPRRYWRRSATDRIPRRYFPPFPCATLLAAPPCLDFISTSRLRLRLAVRLDGARNEVLASPRLLDYAPARALSVGFHSHNRVAAFLWDPRSH